MMTSWQSQGHWLNSGRAVSELARRGFKGTVLAGEGDDGIPVFRVPADAGPITSEDVYRVLSEWP